MSIFAQLLFVTSCLPVWISLLARVVMVSSLITLMDIKPALVSPLRLLYVFHFKAPLSVAHWLILILLQDQLSFNQFIADQAHARGLSVGLKNDLDQSKTLEPYFDWALNEQCKEYDECDSLSNFISAVRIVVFGQHARNLHQWRSNSRFNCCFRVRPCSTVSIPVQPPLSAPTWSESSSLLWSRHWTWLPPSRLNAVPTKAVAVVLPLTNVCPLLWRGYVSPYYHRALQDWLRGVQERSESHLTPQHRFQLLMNSSELNCWRQRNRRDGYWRVYNTRGSSYRYCFFRIYNIWCFVTYCCWCCCSRHIGFRSLNTLNIQTQRKYS